MGGKISTEIYPMSDDINQTDQDQVSDNELNDGFNNMRNQTNLVGSTEIVELSRTERINRSFNINTVWKNIYDIKDPYVWIYGSKHDPKIWWMMPEDISRQLERLYVQYQQDQSQDSILILLDQQRLKIDFNQMIQKNLVYNTIREIYRLTKAELTVLKDSYCKFLQSRTTYWMYGSNRTYVIYSPEIHEALDRSNQCNFHLNGQHYTINTDEMCQYKNKQYQRESSSDHHDQIYKITNLNNVMDKKIYGSCFVVENLFNDLNKVTEDRRSDQNHDPVE